MYVGVFLRCFVRSIVDLVDHEGIEYAGYMSFLLMLSIFPLLILFFIITAYIHEENLAHTLISIIINSSWAHFIDALKPRINEITSTPPQSFVTLVIIGAVWTSSSLFEGMRCILNKAYRVEDPPNYIMRRIWSIIEFGFVLTMLILLTFILVFMPYILNWLDLHVYNSSNQIILFFRPEYLAIRSFILMTFGFMTICGIYYFLPNRRQTIKYTLPGVLLVIVGWYGFSLLFKWYLVTFPQFNVIYGSIAGVMIALFYFYICSIIFIFGAEFNYNLEKIVKYRCF